MINKWISVDEKLPERNGRYLTHCKIEGQSLVCILYYSKVDGFNEGTVTHWMPLPEAPKERSENDHSKDIKENALFAERFARELI